MEKVLKRFNMSDAKPVNVPLGGHFKLSKAQTPTMEDEKALISEVSYASAVGSLVYAIVYTRPDIAQAVRVVSSYMSNLKEEYWRAVKYILRYLKGSSYMALWYNGMDIPQHGYVDSNFAGDVDSRKSTTCYVFTSEKWSSELGVEPAKDSYLVYDRGRICCSDVRS